MEITHWTNELELALINNDVPTFKRIVSGMGNILLSNDKYLIPIMRDLCMKSKKMPVQYRLRDRECLGISVALYPITILEYCQLHIPIWSKPIKEWKTGILGVIGAGYLLTRAFANTLKEKHGKDGKVSATRIPMEIWDNERCVKFFEEDEPWEGKIDISNYKRVTML